MINPDLDQTMAEVCDMLPNALRRLYDGYIESGFTIDASIDFCMEFQRAYILLKLGKEEE